MNDDLYTLAEEIIRLAKGKNLTIATAESCTGGWVSKFLTDIPGSSSVYRGSIIAYANEIKENLLGVPKNLMVEHGAVSQQTATEMAKNCAQAFSVNIAISVTGIAGPGGGTNEKPVGLVYIGLYCNGKVITEEFRLKDSGRDSVRIAAVEKSLQHLSNQISDY